MEIADFARITYNVLDGTPFDDYIPTLCLPAQSKLLALEGIPKEEANVREIVFDWACRTAVNGEEFLVAFRDGTAHFRIIRRFEGEIREALYPAKRPKS
ncbi:MAG: hypothetical protein QM715_17345 [Nibricoccus sp.]